jgi:magnesium transporter
MKSVKFHKLTWIDFAEPSADDILYLQENFDIHPLAIEEFATPTIRPKATPYHNCLYLAIHIPLYDVKKRTTYPGELDIVITKDHLITGHVESIYQLTQFFQNLENSDGKKRLYMDRDPAHLLYHLLELLLESCFPKLDHIAENLNRIEEEIFNGNEKDMVEELSIVKRDILNFRRTLKPQRSVLESILQKEEASFISNDIKPYYQDLIGTNIRLWNNLESAKETVESLEETNNSLLSYKLNITMKILTIFSAVLLPMTVYSNILAMSADIPFGRNPYGFWIHMTILGFIGLLTIILFKVKKWL